MLLYGMWLNSDNGSGKLANLGKFSFLRLVAETLRLVKRERDKKGVTYTRKDMIR